jgi:hypothetical protein
MSVEAHAEFLQFRRARGFPNRDGNIDRWQRVLVQAKGFTGESFDAVASNGTAEDASGDAQSQPRMSFIIGEDRQGEKCIAEFSAPPLHIAKFGRLVQSLARLERKFTDRKEPVATRYGQSSLRPFARRRASNARPLFVAMRARKPWVRARCKLLGLKVRFIARLEQKLWGKSMGWVIYKGRQGY